MELLCHERGRDACVSYPGHSWAVAGKWRKLRVSAASMRFGRLTEVRGLSSIGRAPALQAGGQEFDSPRLHVFLIASALLRPGAGFRPDRADGATGGRDRRCRRCGQEHAGCGGCGAPSRLTWRSCPWTTSSCAIACSTTRGNTAGTGNASFARCSIRSAAATRQLPAARVGIKLAERTGQPSRRRDCVSRGQHGCIPISQRGQ